VVAEIQSEVRKVVQEITVIGKTAKEEAEKGKVISETLLKLTKTMEVFSDIWTTP